MQELVLREQTEEDEMVNVPPGTWEKELSTPSTNSSGNTTVSIRSGKDKSKDPPSRATLTIAVIYNNLWIESAGKGDKELALCEIKSVMKEAENILNDQFAYIQYYRLGVSVKFNLINGGKK